MNVLFAPDWKSGNPYQSLLASALADLGVQVEFLSTYRRGLPLARGVHGSKADVMHLHWPEAYFPQTDTIVGFFRALKFPVDLHLATRRRALVVTGHNLLPHNWKATQVIRRAIAAAFQSAHRVVAHSSRSREILISAYRLSPERVAVIPHGDLAPPGIPLPGLRESRSTLGLSDVGPVVVMFGRVEPYKGCDELISFWRENVKNGRLLIAGEAPYPQYTGRIHELAASSPNIEFRLGHLSEEELRVTLGAATAVIFNYTRISTSGAACLARSYGVPILIPARLDTVDLQEPDPRVLRFESFEQIPELIERAESLSTNYQFAEGFREHCSWRRVAELTATVYADAARCAG